MKFILFLLLLIFTYSPFFYGQETYTAIITDPQVGSTNGEKFLSSIVEDINSRKTIESVVVLGNLTFNGKMDELILVQDILSRLTIPVRLIIGPNDNFLTGGTGNYYDENWTDNSGVVNGKNSIKIFLENIPEKNFTKGHIPIEIINAAKSLDGGESTYIIFSYYPLDESIDNWFAFTNNFKGKKIISFSTIPEKNKNNPIKNINVSSLNENKDWEYNIISESNDSLKIFTISEKKDSPVSLEALAKFELNFVTLIDSAQTLTYSKNVQVKTLSELNRTTYSNTIYDEGKIFTGSVDGRISCLNNHGNLIWEYNTNGSIYTSILKDRDLIISMTSEGDLFTINANNGDLVQVIGTGEIISSDIELIDLDYNDMQTKGIIFGTSEGNIYCYEIYSLEMVWENNLAGEKITSSPLTIKDKIIYQDGAKTSYCVNADNGLLLWTWQPSKKSTNIFFQSDLISDGKSIFISDSDGNLHSIDLLLGTETWNKQKLNASGKIFARSETGEISIHSTKNKMLVIDGIEGKLKREIILAQESQNSLPTCWEVINKNIFIGFDNGFICNIDSNYKANIILFAGNSPIISLWNSNGNEFIATNLDSKIIQFTVK